MLVAGGEILLGRAPPAFGQEVVEQVGVLAGDPEQAAGAFGAAKDVIHAQEVDRLEVGGHRLGGVGFEAAGHVFEVKLAIGGADGLLVFGRALEQFVVHQGVGELAVVGRATASAGDRAAG